VQPAKIYRRPPKICIVPRRLYRIVWFTLKRYRTYRNCQNTNDALYHSRRIALHHSCRTACVI